MRITQLKLERYRRFSDYTLDFCHPVSRHPLDLVALVGDNGSGKSSILQAIAAALGTATGQIHHPQELDWPGYSYNGLSATHRGYMRVALSVEFSDEERQATLEYFNESDFSERDDVVMPGNEPIVELTMTNAPERRPVTAPKSAQLFQFRGRLYAYNLLRRGPPDMFKRIGSVYWYHEQRTSHSLTPFAEADSPLTGDQAIRRMITNWYATEGQPKVRRFRELYARLFPGRTLSRLGDTFSSEEPPVYFVDADRREYELSELSGGERALLPILLDFVQRDIHNSVILIDELELHLHPPLQQALLAVLPEFGTNNQFIITTHSEAIASLLPESQIRRVEIQELA